jgi:hypothetical protein
MKKVGDVMVKKGLEKTWPEGQAMISAFRK